VAVVELVLPDGDGRELFGELRRANPGVSIVVLSATIEAGHLEKVESPLTLASEVRRVVGG
jgi:DNA-binding response OmpR family regulator